MAVVVVLKQPMSLPEQGVQAVQQAPQLAALHSLVEPLVQQEPYQQEQAETVVTAIR